MKNNVFKSFRFEIVLYSLLSLVYTILTEVAVFFGIFIIYYTLNQSPNRIGIQNNPNNRLFNKYDNSIPAPSSAQGRVPGSSADGSFNDSLNNSLNGNLMNDGLISSNPFGLSGGMLYALIGFFIVLAIVLFITYFLLLTKKFATYLGEILWGITELSQGNFNTRIQIRNEDEFALIASRLNQMAGNIKNIIENDRKNETNKNELITSVAHDLRTPLTSVIGYLELVSNKEKLNEDVRERYIEIAYLKSKHLEKLIEDLFAYTKFSFGEVALEPAQIDMVKFMNQLVDEFYPSFVDFELEYEFIHDVPSAIVEADGNLLARAFGNLISNAIKYGKDGKRVEVKLTTENKKVMISIINYGILIPEKDIEQIFERFYRVENSRSSETGGSGLGLAIARNIIKIHEGTITVRSDLNGTVFCVTLNEM